MFLPSVAAGAFPPLPPLDFLSEPPIRMEKKRPPSAPLAAQYLTQHRCIYFAENATRMCGLPVSQDHPHYCETHVKASTTDWLRRFAELYLTDTSPEESQPVVMLASTISGR